MSDIYTKWLNNKWKHFKYGDLVMVEYGNKPTGIVVGEPKPRYGLMSKITYPNGYVNPPVYTKLEVPNSVNYLEYPILIPDTEETSNNQKWYWPNGLFNAFYKTRNKENDPFISYIHPSYLTLLEEG